MVPIMEVKILRNFAKSVIVVVCFPSRVCSKSYSLHGFAQDILCSWKQQGYLFVFRLMLDIFYFH